MWANWYYSLLSLLLFIFAGIEGDFTRLYLDALKSYNTSLAPSPSSSSSSMHTPRERDAIMTSSQRKLLTQHQRLKNQTAIPTTARDRVEEKGDGARKSGSGVRAGAGGEGPGSVGMISVQSLSEKAVALCRGCLVRYYLRNISKKRQSKINLAFRKILLLQQVRVNCISRTFSSQASLCDISV